MDRQHRGNRGHGLDQLRLGRERHAQAFADDGGDLPEVRVAGVEAHPCRRLLVDDQRQAHAQSIGVELQVNLIAHHPQMQPGLTCLEVQADVRCVHPVQRGVPHQLRQGRVGRQFVTG